MSERDRIYKFVEECIRDGDVYERIHEVSGVDDVLEKEDIEVVLKRNKDFINSLDEDSIDAYYFLMKQFKKGNVRIADAESWAAFNYGGFFFDMNNKLMIFNNC